MIKLEHVNKYFYKHKKNQIHVIDDTSLTLGENGLVALLGSSGSGKTTLLNAIGGLDKVNKGKIYINGQKITRKRSYKVDKIRNMNIGYIFQDYYLVDSMSVYDNVALSLKINGIKNKKEIKKRVNYVLEKVGMYRYRNRYTNMLSGGERQRVGIARAIVKNPSIIIADEPTGNLDSKNSLLVMNIIKAISKDRLVILVTHERELAEFYASRILEIEDGKIIKDIDNKHTNDLDYRIDNNIYLKDFKTKETIKKDDVLINYYSDTKENINIDIVVKNGNIFIRNNTIAKADIIDDNSSFELVDDHYQKMSKSIYEEYDFDFESVIDKKTKQRYSSIFNPITLIINGFRKIRNYSLVKKLLLLGFFASGMFITYSISSVLGVTDIKDKDFVTINKEYLIINTGSKIDLKQYLEIEKNPNVNYIIPGQSNVSFRLPVSNSYQTYNYSDNIRGSLSSVNMIKESDIIYGTYPKDSYEIVVDKLIIDYLFNNGSIALTGINTYDKFIGREVTLSPLKNFKIVGIVDKDSPSIYTSEEHFINILYNSSDEGVGEYYFYDYAIDKRYNEETEKVLLDYNIKKSSIKKKKGRWPTKTYEVMVNYQNKDTYKLNKTINVKVNGKKLKVVGYYTSSDGLDKYLVSNTTIKYDLVKNSSDIIVYTKDKDLMLNYFREENLNTEDTYTKAYNNYYNSIKDVIKSKVILCVIILLISFVEIYLMIRASFLSRIREVGIYRAIGLKKKDIYRMFMGEIIAITTIGSLSGTLLMSYILKQLSTITYMQKSIKMNIYIVLIAIAVAYTFNLIVGLLPVKKTLRKTPAQILSRSDI